MPGEFTLHGVFVSTLVAMMVLAWGLGSGLALVLRRTGTYRHIWHPPLFNLAVFVVVLDGLLRLLHGASS